MRLIAGRSARQGYVLLTLLLLVLVAAPLLIPAAPDTVFARKYGGKNYSARYAKYIARCKGACGRKNGAIRACIARDKKRAVGNCRQVFNADRGLCSDKTCTGQLKAQLKLCVRDAGGRARNDANAIARRGYGIKKCGACCQRTKGGGGCLSYFSASRFYGSSRYRGRLSCYGSGGPGGSCEQQCELAASRGRRACGNPRKGDPACLQQVEEALRACLAACHGPGSPSGAFLGNLSGRIRDRVASWLPWLVRGWSD